MTLGDAIGPIVDYAMVEQEWLDLANTWHHDYLLAVEQANSEQSRMWDRVGHYRLDRRGRPEREDLMPLLTCSCDGEIDNPTDDGQGDISGRARVRYALFVHTRWREDAHVMVRRYGWALATLAEQQSGTLDLSQLVTRPRQVYDQIILGEDDAVEAVVVQFDVQVDEIRRRWRGIHDPTPPNEPPVYPDTPTVTDVELQLEPVAPGDDLP